MTPQQHRRANQLFLAAVELEPAAIAPFLRTQCDDSEVLRQVYALLAADGATTGVLADAHARTGEPAAAPQRVMGERGYRLLRELGRGGMGSVYLAEREDGAFQQQVAVKLMHADLRLDADAIRRFVAERQILAGLEHPNIARLLDGGALPDGLPYLVMERVEGESIDRYCERAGLVATARLALLVKVCRAVAVAHQALIVHRDLKPSNILVTADGEPKLLDFGIAKVLDAGASGVSLLHTRTGLSPMTLAYASPEQVRGERIGTASDIYSLGVIAYQLLTGTLPYTVAGHDPVRMAQAVCEEQPTPPSRKSRLALQTDGSGVLESSPPSPAPGTGLKLPRSMRGDLDAIVLKALRKEPQQRYGSVSELADDLQRFLSGQPVAARAGQRGYVMRKFLWRHRFGVAVATVALVALLAFVVVLQQQLARTRIERDRATAVTAFVVGMFRQSDPLAEVQGSSAARAQLTVREVLDAQAPRIEAELNDQPQVQAELLATVGRVYMSLDQRDSAEHYLAAALARLDALEPAPSTAKLQLWLATCEVLGLRGRERTLAACSTALQMARQLSPGEADEQVAQALRGRANALQQLGRGDEAEVDARAALATFQQLQRPEWVAALQGTLADLAYLRGDLDGCLAQVEPALTQWTERFGRDHALRAGMLSTRAKCNVAMGKTAAAEADLREALALTEQAVGEGAAVGNRSQLLNDLGLVLNQQSRFAEAEPMLREAYRVAVAIYGPEHPEVNSVLLSLSLAVDGLGHVDEGLDLLRQALVIARKYPQNQRALSITTNNLGSRLLREKHLEDAEPLLREALAIYTAIDPKHPDRAAPLVNLGTVLTDTRRAAEALPLLEEGLALREAMLQAGSWQIETARSVLGACLVEVGRRDEGLVLLRSASAALQNTLGADHRRSREALGRLEHATRMAPSSGR